VAKTDNTLSYSRFITGKFFVDGDVLQTQKRFALEKKGAEFSRTLFGCVLENAHPSKLLFVTKRSVMDLWRLRRAE
jgi:hypothetical protein